MRNLIWIAMIVFVIQISFAQDFALDTNCQSCLNIQEAHKSMLNSQYFDATHRFAFAIQGQEVIPWSIYETNQAFSVYWKNEKTTIQIHGHSKGVVSSIRWTFKNEENAKEFSCNILNANNDFSIRLGKNAGERETSIITECSSQFQQALDSGKISNISDVAIHIATMLNLQTTTNRDVENIHGNFRVSSPQSVKYGNGKVIQFHLLITSSNGGSLRHEIIGGYLFLTAVLGTWGGEYWIWQEK